MMKKLIQRWLEIDTLQNGQRTLRGDVENLGKATDLLVRNEEKKKRAKRAQKLKQEFDRQAEAKTSSRPALKAFKGGRS